MGSLSFAACRLDLTAPLEGNFNDDKVIDCAAWWFNVVGEDLEEGQEVAAFKNFLPNV